MLSRRLTHSVPVGGDHHSSALFRLLVLVLNQPPLVNDTQITHVGLGGVHQLHEEDALGTAGVAEQTGGGVNEDGSGGQRLVVVAALNGGHIAAQADAHPGAHCDAAANLLGVAAAAHHGNVHLGAQVRQLGANFDGHPQRQRPQKVLQAPGIVLLCLLVSAVDVEQFNEITLWRGKLPVHLQRLVTLVGR
ncbi:hypothetical protein TYRP_013436 [Tyrophagus putrescentiae]|nr:hypothetical protein TYRP_013436 [Tyrophagus putrescentiae]